MGKLQGRSNAGGGVCDVEGGEMGNCNNEKVGRRGVCRRCYKTFFSVFYEFSW
jgi:hypothetical protein